MQTMRCSTLMTSQATRLLKAECHGRVKRRKGDTQVDVTQRRQVGAPIGTLIGVYIGTIFWRVTSPLP